MVGSNNHRMNNLSSLIENLSAHNEDRRVLCLKIAGEVLLYALIVPTIEQQMNKINLWNYYRTIEMPSLNIILQMLLNGILINREELVHTQEDLLVSMIFHRYLFV